MSAETTDERDWRLRAELQGERRAGALHGLVGRVRGHDETLQEAKDAVGPDVVVTHDGDALFAYAASREAIERARTAIAAALEREGVQATLQLASWNEQLGRWVDPDEPAEQLAAEARAGEATGTRTYVATVGRWIREEFEQSMRETADRLGLRCEIVEHPHLLSSQVAVTVTGAARKLDEFAAAMKAEERATIRTETAVMASPL